MVGRAGNAIVATSIRSAGRVRVASAVVQVRMANVLPGPARPWMTPTARCSAVSVTTWRASCSCEVEIRRAPGGPASGGRRVTTGCTPGRRPGPRRARRWRAGRPRPPARPAAPAGRCRAGWYSPSGAFVRGRGPLGRPGGGVELLGLLVGQRVVRVAGGQVLPVEVDVDEPVVVRHVPQAHLLPAPLADQPGRAHVDQVAEVD